MKDGDSRQDTEIAVFSFLERGIAQLSPEIEPSKVQQLADLVMLLESWASKINLTGHRDPISMAGRLVLDAVALNAALPELHTSRSFADLGTGAGFPGLPLAVLNPDADAYLVDSRLKRNHFQRAARRALGLENTRPVLGRSDEVDQIPCDLVVAQAMTQPTEALQLMSQWAGRDGLLALPASEFAELPQTPDGYAPAELREYVVPETGTQRRLWLVRPEDS
jgi:16S rRNA (guanine527-N7)-methyltransferase